MLSVEAHSCVRCTFLRVTQYSSFALSLSLSLGSTDFFNILPVSVEVEGSAEAMIELCIRNDNITLEYDDTVILEFTPDEDDLIDFYEDEGEYIRDSVVVRIIDNDRK